ncbi:DUF3095 domain-containing protein [Rhizobium sp. YIM 134829]|uniref:DUF3095 domain-containing protein n=1 Tax=Rhizobium sp. YIM 134829 TaxID=3390453 RepID=UPI00397A78B1
MPAPTSDPFFRTLPLFTAFAGVAEAANYRPLPEDWWLASADIVDSTGAIAKGQYKSVNMAGASVISAVLNAVGNYEIPFVFSGDGALLALPPSGLDATRVALAAVQTHVAATLGLDLRAALVPVADIRAAGLDVRVARFRASSEVSYAMFTGGGGAWAEAQMKAGLYRVQPASDDSQPDLTGLSCRWSPIPARHGAIVSIIAVPVAGTDPRAFEALTSDIIGLAAQEERSGHPVPPDGPPAALSIEGLNIEGKVAPEGKRLKQGLSAYLQAVLTLALIKTRTTLGRFDPRRYRQDIASNSDFRKFDDGLKMTIDVDAGRRAAIEARLEAAAAEGICRYGLHVQDAALMTCIVPTPLARDHMHFIDGADGGYARAASLIKAERAALTP